MGERFDVVVFGVTGFTGTFILRVIASSRLFEGKTLAVAGRNEGKIRSVLAEVASQTGIDRISSLPVLIADVSDGEGLAAMAKRAKVVINAVGPYTLHGEAVVRAAVENGASHLDISGEPQYLETMAVKYSQLARENGVFVVGSCGFDTVPCDLGVDYLKRHFPGTLANVETVVICELGTAGYSANTGTLHSVMLIVPNELSRLWKGASRELMPLSTPRSSHRPPCRMPLRHVRRGGLDGWAMPFPGYDKDIVARSQYYDFHVNGRRPVTISTYFAISSVWYAIGLCAWLAPFGLAALFPPTRKLLLAYPDKLSFGMFKSSGPSTQQIKETRFSYYFYGKGWGSGQELDDAVTPTTEATAVCHGPDPGYNATAGFIASAALAILNDRPSMPKEGGVYTAASAFRDTRIYDYLADFGITFTLLP